MYNTVFFYGLDQDNYLKFSDKIFSLNSSAKIIRFTNIYHLLSTIRVYSLLIENTKQDFPRHLFFDEKLGALNYSHFIEVFEGLRLEDNNIHEMSLLPIFTSNDGTGDRSMVLELDYVSEYIESETLEIYPNNTMLN